MTPERRAKLLSVLGKRQDDLTVVLENVFDPHNISAVMRTCDAVGVQEIYVLNTRIPPHKKWGRRSSSSAEKWLTIHQFDNADECFSSLRNRYSKILTTCLTDDAVSLHAINFTLSQKSPVPILGPGSYHPKTIDEIYREKFCSKYGPYYQQSIRFPSKSNV